MCNRLQLSVADRCCDKPWDPARTGLPGAFSAFPEQDGGCMVAAAPGRARQHGTSSGHKPSAPMERGKASVPPRAKRRADTLRDTAFCLYASSTFSISSSL